MKVLGVACGIASVGWSLLDMGGPRASNGMKIIAAGVWSFDTPETPKERTPLNAVRRLHRGQRRVIRRRRQRMNEIRRLFHTAGLLPSESSDALAQPGLDPWTLRAAALSRVLSGPELAVALGHIAVHRGFRSNSQKPERNTADESSKMLKAIAATQERLHGRTIGLMFATDPEFQDRKRNRGDFARSVLRADLEYEVRQIFNAQRRLRNSQATADLEESFSRVAFYQRPLADSEHMVGACRFEPDEKRTALRGYSFELFRLLSRLANITLSDDGKHFRLDGRMIRAIAEDFGASKRISYRSVRETLSLGPLVRFVGVSEKDERNDVVARQGNAAEGTHALRQAVGPEAWLLLTRRRALLDRIAEVLTFRVDPDSIRLGLAEAGLGSPLLDTVMAGVESGAFSQFQGTGHLSAKAARALIPALLRGAGYAAACEAAGYFHDAPQRVSLEDLRNPVARRAVTEAVKQVQAIVAAHGRPDAIHISLMRDVGKSADERDQISRGIEDQNKKREASRTELEELLGRNTKGDELLRYELWKEQAGRCLYTGEAIDPSWIADDDNRVQIGHILPWSRFGDDSFLNKTLCLARAAQTKRDRTPFEWLGETDWPAFTARVEACKQMKRVKKAGYYLRQNASEIEEAFRERHLSDTRYIARFLRFLLSQTYRDVRVRARPVQLIAKLRRAWGLNDVKHDSEGKRKSDNRHRALDAVILATISERALEELAKAASEAERQGLSRGLVFDEVEPPAEGFRDTVLDVITGIFPARAERRRMRGEIHAATIKRVKTIAGKTIVFERKPIEKLTLADLDNIPTPTPYGHAADPRKLRDEMVETIRRWIERERPKDDPPRSPKGDIIRKVRVATAGEVRVQVRGGTADRGEMARVDVFQAVSKRGAPRYYFVPVYPHQIADRTAWPKPPDRAVVAGKPESGWAIMGEDANFLFSLYSHSLVEVTKPDGEIVRGYFKGLDRATGVIALATPENIQDPPRRTGAKTLRGLEKLRADRLGRVTQVSQETRTWHGVACT